MFLIDIVAEKARVWAKQLQTAGISAGDVAFCISVTSDMIGGLLSGEIRLAPELKIRITAVLDEV
jgi:plasmid maintenance system antidote protein VapI